jgi:hypothetical protein
VVSKFRAKKSRSFNSRICFPADPDEHVRQQVQELRPVHPGPLLRMEPRVWRVPAERSSSGLLDFSSKYILLCM